jgi:AraC-like DNA-binding protein
MDVLSDALRIIRLTSAVFFTAKFTSPWSVTSPPAERLRPIFAPEAECMALFHILAEGAPCWIAIDGKAPIKVSPGDVIIFPQGDQHVMTSDLALPAPPFEKSLRGLVTTRENTAPGCLPALRYGGGGPVTNLVCGYLHCDQRFNPLFGAMPQAICVRVRDGAALVQSTGATTELRQIAMPPETANWLETTLRYTVAEAQGAGAASSAMLARLTELMFAEVMRRYVEHLPAGESGWLAGLHDPQIGRVLKLIHAEPARDWTVAALGKAAGISRSALAERFAALIGEAPMRYLAGWRMQLAKRLLRESGQSVAEIAAAVGYESEAAFNRAFRRLVGKPPATWRDGDKVAVGGPPFVGAGLIPADVIPDSRVGFTGGCGCDSLRRLIRLGESSWRWRSDDASFRPRSCGRRRGGRRRATRRAGCSRLPW